MTVPTSFRKTIDQMAKTEDATERRRLGGIFASQLEVALNDQANKAQVVIWEAQERAEGKIDALNEQVGYTNTLISAAIAGQSSQAERIEQSLGEVVRGLGKLASDVSDLGEQQQESREDRAGIHAEIAEIKALLNQSEITEIKAAIDARADHDRRIQALEENNARIEAIEQAIQELRAERGSGDR